MTQQEQEKEAHEFANAWQGRGDEKSDTHNFWIDLLGNVYGVANPARYFVKYEGRVKSTKTVGNVTKITTNFYDGYIESTKVLIEQKSISIDLDKPEHQSDGRMLTPYEQAKDYIKNMPQEDHPKWVVICNFKEFRVYDMNKPLDPYQSIMLADLEKEFYRLSFLVDTGNAHLKREMELSIQAGVIVGEIYDALIKQYKNPENPESLKSLNMLCVRLVFCLYAEDAGIFGHKSMFHDYLNRFESRDIRKALIDLFAVLDTKEKDRDPYLDEVISAFPYVNGGLFTDTTIEIPNFTDEIKALLLKNASDDFNWSEISPTIFGAVFESTLNPETRRSGGMHYTSIENIHKVIDPLFYNELNQEFETIQETKSEKTRNAKLQEFQKKLGTLKFLDPACGSGNFLTETYLSLRKLENKCIKLRLGVHGAALDLLGEDFAIQVLIHQFYGIEINDFAAVVAKTALWIAESQMMNETSKMLGRNLDFLPLKSYSNIVEGNALRMDWSTFLPVTDKKDVIYADKANIYKVDSDEEMSVCEPESKYGEVNIVTKEIEFKNIKDLKEPQAEKVEFDYIMGNPPFVGYAFRTDRQKEDLSIVDKSIGKNIDYVAGWYLKAAELIENTKTRCAFVSTNSIIQGEQVSELWKPVVIKKNIKIDFAYRTFRWDSESSSKAHVHCVIIGFSWYKNQFNKFIIDESGHKNSATNINSYLIDAPNIFIDKRKQPLSNVSKINKGSQPTDGGNLIIEDNDYDEFLKKEPNAKKFIHNFVGAEEFINNKKRYCLWLVGASPAELRKMPNVMKRIEAVKEMRLSSTKEATRNWAAYPYLFTENRQPENCNYLLIPRVSSEKRRYIPIGYLSSDIIASDAAQVIPNATLYEFGILTSNVHNSWMRVVCGRLKSDYRYSNDIVYNNFPWCTPTAEQKAKIEQTAQTILDARALFPDSSLAALYVETLMPKELRKAHQENDKAVLQAYGFPIKMTESECVAELFKMYSQLAKASL